MHQTGRAIVLLLGLSALVSGGCRDAAGQRTTVWDWARSHRDKPAKTDSRHEPAAAGDQAANGDGERAEAITKAVGPEANCSGVKPRDSGDTGAARVTPVAARSDAGASAPEGDVRSTDDPRRTPRAGPTPSAHAVCSDALVVNNETISVDDILEPIMPTIEDLSRRVSPKAYYQRVVELVRVQIIEAVAQHLIWRKAQEMVKEEMNKQIDKAVERAEKERINREFNGSETRYGKYLAEHDKTRDQVRQRLRRSIIIEGYLRDRLLPLVPSPRRQELEQYYHAHIDEFTTPARREMFLIDLPVAAFLEAPRGSRPSGEQIEQARAKGREVAQEAAAVLGAGQTFEDVARAYSRDVNRDKGGAWGFISGQLQGRWAEPSRRLFAMKSGETSEVIETADSFFIVKVGQVEDGQAISFQDAQPQIIEHLRQQRFVRLRADFLQKELEQSTIGSIDAFATEVQKAIPPPRMASP